MNCIVGFEQIHKNYVLEYICCSSPSHAMASASSRPARSPERGHPLRLPLLPHLRLHPHRLLPSPRRLPRCWGDQAHPGQGAHGLRSHGARGYEAAILSHDGPKKMFGFLSPSRSANVCNSCLSTSLYQSMKILKTFTPIAHHKSLQLAKRLESPHQWTRLTTVGAMVQPVQPL